MSDFQQNPDQRDDNFQEDYGDTYNDRGGSNGGYDDNDYYEDYNDDGNRPNKSLKGYKVVVIVLALILLALSALYFSQVRKIKGEFVAEKITLTEEMLALRGDLDTLQTHNDTINKHLSEERLRADSLIEKIQNERNISYSKIRKYEKELGTLRNVMKGFVQQIDSLNTLNKQLIVSEAHQRQVATTERLRADAAEERVQELDVKVAQGSVVSVRGINIVPLSNTSKEVTRASRATRLRIDFTLSANELANPGARNVYARITGPDGYTMAASAGSTFGFEGDQLTYTASREIDYQNSDLPVALFYNGSGITNGVYSVEVFMDGRLLGRREVALK